MTTSTSRLLTTAAGLALAVSGDGRRPPGPGRRDPGLYERRPHRVLPRGGGALGTLYGRIVLRNTSDHACHTGGYGGISYVGDGNGTQIGAPARRIDASDVATYVLQPGQRLRSTIGETEAGNYPRKRCHPAHVDGFRIYVPNATASQYVVHPTTGCRNAHVRLISQKPYRRP